MFVPRWCRKCFQLCYLDSDIGLCSSCIEKERRSKMKRIFCPFCGQTFVISDDGTILSVEAGDTGDETKICKTCTGQPGGLEETIRRTY